MGKRHARQAANRGNQVRSDTPQQIAIYAASHGIPAVERWQEVSPGSSFQEWDLLVAEHRPGHWQVIRPEDVSSHLGRGHSVMLGVGSYDVWHMKAKYGEGEFSGWPGPFPYPYPKF